MKFMKEHKIADGFADIKSGEMKQIKLGEMKILLARVGDECFAVGANCTHYGAPLAKGPFPETALFARGTTHVSMCPTETGSSPRRLTPCQATR